MAQNLQKYFQFSPFFTGSTEMSDLMWERLQEKIDRIPVSLYNFLVDDKTSVIIETLSQKYIQLSVQGPDVARLIRDVVTGDIFIGDMPKEISNRLGIDQTLAREVANQIVSQLFTPVLEDIKKVQNERYPGRLPAKPLTQQVSGDRGQVSGQGEQATQVKPAQVKPAKTHYPGEELPESGGNIIDLRNKI